MAAADQQFLDALRFLGQSGQQYGIKRQMDQVNERAEEIQSTMTNEIERRQALRALALKANISVSGSGGNAQQAAAINNLIPPVPTSVASAYLQGSLTGDSQMVGVAKKMQDEDEARQLRLLERKATFEMMLQEKKEQSKNNPEAMAIRKENRKAYADLLASKQKAIETMAKLNDVDRLMSKGIVVDTGPVDQLFTPFSPEAQSIKQRMNELSLNNMVSMFSGMSKAVDTEGERKAFESTQLSMGNYASVNRDYIARQKQALQQTIKKANKAIFSYKNTGGLSFEAFDQEEPNTTPGYKTLPPAGAAKPFYTPSDE